MLCISPNLSWQPKEKSDTFTWWLIPAFVQMGQISFGCICPPSWMTEGALTLAINKSNRATKLLLRKLTILALKKKGEK